MTKTELSNAAFFITFSSLFLSADIMKDCSSACMYRTLVILEQEQLQDITDGRMTAAARGWIKEG